AWLTHQWLKKAVLLSFRLEDNRVIDAGATRYYDKVPAKFGPQFDFAAAGFRVVPPAMVRRGAHIARNAVLMPCYVNIGAYVDEGTMVVPGTLPSSDGKCYLYCAVIVKTVDAKTRAKTSLNELLRGD